MRGGQDLGIGVGFWSSMFSRIEHLDDINVEVLYLQSFLSFCFLCFLSLTLASLFAIFAPVSICLQLLFCSPELSLFTSHLFYSLIISRFTYYFSFSVYSFSLFILRLHARLSPNYVSGEHEKSLFPTCRSLELHRYRCLQLAVVLVLSQVSIGTISKQRIKVLDSQYNCTISSLLPIATPYEHLWAAQIPKHCLPWPLFSSMIVL